ncbi:MAG: T9SS type A sorting domain-containing protein [Flavobacteriales bacterium]|nr:T9SS type A sorting domain-containing protein [Flavobacteriales bacterium]
MKIKLISAIITSLLVISFNGHSNNFDWLEPFGGASNDNSESVAVDVSGSVYTTGGFQETVDFDPSSATFELTSSGNFDCFISKIDDHGEFVWAKSISGLSKIYGTSIHVNVFGKILITGYFKDEISIDSVEASAIRNSIGSNDIFVLKLDHTGDFIWLKTFGGVGLDESVEVSSDDADNVYVSGLYSDIVDFDPGPDVYDIESSGETDVFLLKLDTQGEFQWAKSVGGSLWDASRSSTTDGAGNTYVAGYYEATADFDPTIGVDEYTSNGDYDFFVEKFDVNGDVEWMTSFGDIGDDCILSISIDNSGDLISTGFFFGTMDFDPGVNELLLTSNGGADILVMKMDSDGNLIWANSIGGTGTDHGNSIASDLNGNIFSTGYYMEIMDFDPSDGVFLDTSNGNKDVFIQKLSTDGGFVWGLSAGGSSMDEGKDIIVDNSDYAILTGVYRNDVSFSEFDNTSNGAGDVFVWKVDLSTVGVVERVEKKNIKAYPIPTNGPYKIELDDFYSNVMVKTYSINGSVISTNEFVNDRILELNIDGPSGTYLVEIIFKEKSFWSKVIKE